MVGCERVGGAAIFLGPFLVLQMWAGICPDPRGCLIQRRTTYKVSFLGGRVPLDLRFRGPLEAKSFVRGRKIGPPRAPTRVFDLKCASCGHVRRCICAAASSLRETDQLRWGASVPTSIDRFPEGKRLSIGVTVDAQPIGIFGFSDLLFDLNIDELMDSSVR